MLGSALVLSLVPVRAHADEGGYVTGGFIHSFVWGRTNPAGNGAELSFVHYPNGDYPWDVPGFGAFFQAQNYSSPDHGRYAVGGQANLGVGGLELGYAHRDGTKARTTTRGVHIGPFLSVGAASLALRFTIPVAPSARRSHGPETALTLGFKIPFPLYGNVDWVKLRIPSGRPYRVDGEVRHAAAAHDTSWSSPEGCAGDGAGSNGSSRAAAEHWLSSARDEHASIASFTRLVCQLLELGAPARLIEGALRAARDEIQHARVCYELAQHHSDQAWAPGAFPMELGANSKSKSRTEALCALAVESLVDGCLGEQMAAELARLWARQPRGSLENRAWATIATDETRHAELAWHIVEWCAAEGGTVVVAALLDACATLPRTLPDPETTGADAPPLWEQTRAIHQVGRSVMSRMQSAVFGAVAQQGSGTRSRTVQKEAVLGHG